MQEVAQVGVGGSELWIEGVRDDQFYSWVLDGS